MFSINCANPLLSAQQRGLMPATAGSGGGTCATNPAGTFTGSTGAFLGIEVSVEISSREPEAAPPPAAEPVAA